jgi:hypothetical protein
MSDLTACFREQGRLSRDGRRSVEKRDEPGRAASARRARRPAVVYQYDVIYLKEPLTAQAALELVPTKEGVDEVSAGRGVVYFARLISEASQSRPSKLTVLPVYKSVTVRDLEHDDEVRELTS